MANLTDFASLLFSSRTQAHIFHLGTDSYAEHKAMEKYYDSIVDLADGIIEASQGCYGKLKGWTNFEIQDWISTKDTQLYFDELSKTIAAMRLELPQDSWLQNLIDGVAELVEDIKYLLTLK